MSESVATITSQNRKNPQLQTLIDLYGGDPSRPKVSYSVFKLASIAFLKENNEVLPTLHTNEEFRDELFHFIQEVQESNKMNSLVTQYALSDESMGGSIQKDTSNDSGNSDILRIHSKTLEPPSLAYS